MSQTTTDPLPAALAEAQARRRTDKLVIFTWGGDLDKVWPTLILATTAAAMGMEVLVFFTFWGLFPLVRNDVRLTGDNWMQKAMSLVHRGGTEHLRLSQLNFAGAGPAMMRKLAADHHVAGPQELLELARDLGVRLVPLPDDHGPARPQARGHDRRARRTGRRGRRARRGPGRHHPVHLTEDVTAWTSSGRGAQLRLGLAIVRQLLLADGGSIELRPAAGAGLDVVVRVRAGRPA